MQVSVEADRIRHQLEIAVESGRGSAAGVAAVRHHLDLAREACRCKTKLRTRGPGDWWRGASIERAFRHLHAAKTFLVDVLPVDDLVVQVPDVTARLAMTFDRNDPRRVDAECRLEKPDGEQLLRAAMRQAMATSYDAADERYIRLRDFRNKILITAAVVLVFVGGLLWAVSTWPEAVPLCFNPEVTTAIPGLPAVNRTVCPSGEGLTPTGGDVWIVVLLGAVGGMLSAISAIRNMRANSAPYGVSAALAVLKVPFGALSAVIGMLLLAGGFIPGLTNLDNQRQILAYSLVFGIAQQLITRVADDRAHQMLDRLPSKDPQAQPGPSMVKPPVPATAVAPSNGRAAQGDLTKAGG